VRPACCTHRRDLALRPYASAKHHRQLQAAQNGIGPRVGGMAGGFQEEGGGLENHRLLHTLLQRGGGKRCTSEHMQSQLMGASSLHDSPCMWSLLHHKLHVEVCFMHMQS